MLNPAGIPFGSNRIDTSCHKYLCKKEMLFVGILGNLTAEISQVQEVISIHEYPEKSMPPRWRHRLPAFPAG